MEAVETVRWLRDCLREDRARRGVREFTSLKREARQLRKAKCEILLEEALQHSGIRMQLKIFRRAQLLLLGAAHSFQREARDVIGAI